MTMVPISDAAKTAEAPDAVQRTGDENALAGLDFGAEPYELITRDVDQWERGGGSHLQPAGNFDEVRGFDGAELGVGMRRHNHDVIAGFEICDALTFLANDPSEAMPRMSGNSTVKTSLTAPERIIQST